MSKHFDKNFEQLVFEHEKTVYRICYRFFNNPEDAMDAAQEVFIRVYKNLKSFRGDSSLKTWIYRIAMNTCINLSSRAKKKKAALTKNALLWLSSFRQETPEEILMDKALEEARAKIAAQELSALPARYSAPIILKDLEDMTIEETAEALNLPQGTVKSRLNRGRKMLESAVQSKVKQIENKKHLQTAGT